MNSAKLTAAMTIYLLARTHWIMAHVPKTSPHSIVRSCWMMTLYLMAEYLKLPLLKKVSYKNKIENKDKNETRMRTRMIIRMKIKIKMGMKMNMISVRDARIVK